MGRKVCHHFVLAVAMGILSSAGLSAKNRSDGDDFPDYNRIEYAKPLPPVDQQVPAPKPGSINMRVGGNDPVDAPQPIQSIPVPLLRPDAKDDQSEPAMTGFFDESASSGTASAAVNRSTGSK